MFSVGFSLLLFHVVRVIGRVFVLLCVLCVSCVVNVRFLLLAVCLLSLFISVVC